MKQQSIEIDLFNDKIDLDLIIKEMFEELKNSKEKIDNLEIENKEKINKISDLTNDIEELKKEIKNIKNEGKVKDKNHLKGEKNIFKNKEKYNKKSFLTKILIPFSLSLFFNLLFSFFNSSYKNELQREIDILKNKNQELIQKFEEWKQKKDNEINALKNDIKELNDELNNLKNGYKGLLKESEEINQVPNLFYERYKIRYFYDNE